MLMWAHQEKKDLDLNLRGCTIHGLRLFLVLPFAPRPFSLRGYSQFQVLKD